MIYADGQIEKSFWFMGKACTEEEFKLQTTIQSAGPAPSSIQEVNEDEDLDKMENPSPKNV